MGETMTRMNLKFSRTKLARSERLDPFHIDRACRRVVHISLSKHGARDCPV